MTDPLGLSTNGYVVRQISGTYVTRTVTTSGDGLSASNQDGDSGNVTITLANDVGAIEALTGSGVPARTGNNTWALREIEGTTDQIVVSNGDGVSGNPTISLENVGTPGAYNYPTSITTNASGQISSISGGNQPMTALSNVGSAASVGKSFTTGTLTLRSIYTADPSQIAITEATDRIEFALGTDLQAIENISGTGMLTRTSTTPTYALRAVTGTAGQITVTNGDGVSGHPTVALADAGAGAGATAYPSSVTLDAKGRVSAIAASGGNLAALDAQLGTGVMCRTGVNAYSLRSLQVGSSQLTISDATGVGGNPTIDLMGLISLRASKSGTQSIGHVTSSAYTSATTLTSWATGGDYDNASLNGFNTTTGVFTAPATAMYDITLHVCFDINNTGERRCYIVNTTDGEVLECNFKQFEISHPAHVWCRFVGRLSSGTTVDFRAGQYNSGSTSLNVLASSGQNTTLSIICFYNQ